MKAVILAGGEGTRLRPLTCTLPKPMVPLCGIPVMEHILRRLSAQGIREAAVTLCYLPEAIRSYFGDGHDFGMELTYFTETEPLGTAGCIAACGDFIDDTTLILSGDGVCDFDFNAALAKHESVHAEATLLLTACSVPLEYGLVITDDAGRIRCFAEKPSWQGVCTNQANTGIYIIEPELLRRIPAGKSDFARDIFPAMLRENAALYGFEAPGFWCDIGDCGAYLGCMRDFLEKQENPGFAERMAEPVYIEPGAVIDPTAVVGPYVYVGRHAVIEGGAVVENSSVEGHIGSNARVRGSILCRGASIGAGAAVEEGTVIGEGAVVGRSAMLCEGVRVWPHRVIPDGAEVRYSVTTGTESAITVTDGLLSAPAGAMSPELCLSLGSAAVRLGARIGAAMEPGHGAEIFRSAFETGVCAGGGNTVSFSADFAAEAAYAAARIRLDLCAYFAYENGLTIRFFDRLGLPLDGGRLRSILSDARRGGFDRPEGNFGRRTRILSLTEDYCRSVNYGNLHGAHFGVSMAGPGKTLCNILWLRGARILPAGSGCPVFAVTDGGFGLEACDEDGNTLSDAKTLACAAYIAAEKGDIAAPFSAPAALNLIAADAGVRLYRAGEDEEGHEKWAQTLYRDGLRRAVFIAAYLRKNELSLRELAEKLPAFAEAERTIDLRSERPEFMREAAALLGSCTFGAGIRAVCGGGCTVIIPCADRPAVRILAESFSDETARELCDGLSERLEGLDSSIKRRKKQSPSF